MVPAGAQDQESSARPDSTQVLYQLKRRLVGPLQVVEDDQERLLGGECGEPRGCCLEQSEPRHLGVYRVRPRLMAARIRNGLVFESVQQAHQVPTAATGGLMAAQCADPRPKGGRTRVLQTGAPEGSPSTSPGHFAHPGCHAGLPDPGLASENDDARVAACSLCKQQFQPLHLGGPPDEVDPVRSCDGLPGNETRPSSTVVNGGPKPDIRGR